MSTISEVLAARGEQRRADKQAGRDEDRKDRDQNEQIKQRRADRRRAQVTAALGWTMTHPVQILMAAVIVVPGLLAWTAMALYGEDIYGLLGVLLPLFTECAMWAFAARSHQAKAKKQPTFMLNLGTWVFAAVAGTLNYLHGAALGGVVTGVVMATVSVGGVVAHQIIQASDTVLLTRAQRRKRRLRVKADRRRHRMEKLTISRADGHVDPAGTVELTFQPGTVSLKRRWYGPGYLEHRSLGDEAEAFLAGLDDLGDTPVPAPEAQAGNTPGPAGADASVPQSADQQQGRGGDTGEEHPAPGGADTATPTPGPRTWTWEELVTAFWAHVDAGTVTPTSQRNVRMTLRCSKDRARDLVELYRDTDDGGSPAAVAA